MKRKELAFLVAFMGLVGLATDLIGGQTHGGASPDGVAVPRTWDDEGFKDYDVPLAIADASPKHAPASYYYRMPERKIYKSYPVYAPGKQPDGYLDWLRRQPPQVAFDPSNLRTEADWARAGGTVFDAPIAFDALITMADLQNPEWYKNSGVPVGRDGVVPFVTYVIREQGKIEVGQFSCATCHTRVLSDGSIVRGAQGNIPLDRLDSVDIRKTAAAQKDKQKFLQDIRSRLRLIYGTPWLQPDPESEIDRMSTEEIAQELENIPPGVQARIGTSILYPVQVPDLIGIKDRLYLDRTGHVIHKSPADLMRYSALNQGAFFYDTYGKYVRPFMPDPSRSERYSDEQLYALALYLYSLKAPPNPNKPGAAAARGQKLFAREGCAGCHTPPLYTSNKLTPVDGFGVPEGHEERYRISPVSVGTDPGLALKTRRGTGYYKIPSLKGVWYRGPFEHSGSVVNLEDWFDPRRQNPGYIPTGYRGFKTRARAIKGHSFGLELSEQERTDLIAFLRTL